ncbi:MAG TPA: hypothetical protein VFX72_04085, partial [Usitatibacteraceae bacterium]|nr:hypothetical protein [Usitatibacteraceae bacterium]
MCNSRAALLATFSLALPLGAAAAVDINVTGEARQEVVSQQFQDRYHSLAAYIGANVGTDVKLVIGTDP